MLSSLGAAPATEDNVTMKTSTPSHDAAWSPAAARATEAAKTDRLRALRLAKEAADAIAAQNAAAAESAKRQPGLRIRKPARVASNANSNEAG